MKLKTSYYFTLGAFLLVLSGCGGDAPHSDLSSTGLNGDDFNSNSNYPKLDASLISISGSLSNQGEALIVAIGKFGSVYSPSENNFVGTNLRLHLQQENVSQDFASLIEANAAGKMGFNSDENGNPKYSALNLGSINPSKPISFVIYFGDIPLLSGQFYLN